LIVLCVCLLAPVSLAACASSPASSPSTSPSQKSATLEVIPVTPTDSAPDGERWWGGDGVHVSVRGDYQQLDPAACELWVNGAKQSLASEPLPSEVGDGVADVSFAIASPIEEPGQYDFRVVLATRGGGRAETSWSFDSDGPMP
jgi:hypothetical protein